VVFNLVFCQTTLPLTKAWKYTVNILEGKKSLTKWYFQTASEFLVVRKFKNCKDFVVV
jgi:hypothetical protein